MGMVSEAVDGLTLQELVEARIEVGRMLTEEECHVLFIQLALAIREVHRQDETHQKIFPDNIKLTNNNETWKLLAPGPVDPAQLPFYSPQVMQQQTYKQPDDIWSLGVIMLFMATGKTPQNVQTDSALVLEEVGFHLMRNFSVEFNQLLESLLKYEPEKRKNINEILHDPYSEGDVLAYIKSGEFNDKMRKVKKNMILADDQNNIYQLECTDAEINEECLEYYRKFLADKPVIITEACRGPLTSWKPYAIKEYSMGYSTPLINPPLLLPYIEPLKTANPAPIAPLPPSFSLLLCPEQISPPENIQGMVFLTQTFPPLTKKKPKTPPLPMTQNQGENWVIKKSTKKNKQYFSTPKVIKQPMLIKFPLFRNKKKDAFFNQKNYQYKAKRKEYYRKTGIIGAHISATSCADGAETFVRRTLLEHLSEEEVGRGYHDAQMAFNVPHPNILRARDVFAKKHDSGLEQVLTAYEFVSGGTLATFVAGRMSFKKPLTLTEVMHYFSQICLALKEIHDSSMIHGDLQLKRILLKDQTIKLAGFSAMQDIDAAQSENYGQTPLPAPEKRYNQQSDVWSLGVIFLHLCLGRAPVEPMVDVEELDEGQFSYVLKSFIRQMFKNDPLQRPTVDQILQHAMIKKHLSKWVNSTLFQVQFKESKQNMLTINNSPTAINLEKPLEKQILRAHVSMTDLDREYRIYVGKVCKLSTLEIPSQQRAMTKEQLFQQYEKVEVLDYDEAGNVLWKVRERYSDEIFLLKQMNLNGLQKTEIQQAEGEVRIFQKVKHLNLQSIKESFQAGGQFFVVQEFCDGGNGTIHTLNMELRHRKNTHQPLTEFEAMTNFSQVCHGLKKMHDMRVAHRQLDSKVIMVTRGGSGQENVLKVSGFGEACGVEKQVSIDEGYYEKYEELDDCRIQSKDSGELFQVQKIDFKELDMTQVSLMQQQTRQLRNLKHRNIVGFVEAFLLTEDKKLAIVSEWSEDEGELRSQITKNKQGLNYFDEETVLSLVYQGARALMLADEWNVCHSDIKPENIRIQASGNIKLGAFGSVSRTAPYESPEQQSSHKNDIWQLGATIHECCSLARAFPQEGKKLRQAIEEKEPFGIPRQFSQELQALISAMMHKKAEERPSAKQVCEHPFIKKAVQRSFGIVSDSDESEVFLDEDIPIDENLWASKFNTLVPESSESVTQKLHWIGNNMGALAKDVWDLSILLLEMAALEPSLSLMHRVEDNLELPAVPDSFTREFRGFVNWMRGAITPTMSEVVNHPFVYPYYYRTGVEIARRGRNQALKTSKDLIAQVKRHIEKKALPGMVFTPLKTSTLNLNSRQLSIMNLSQVKKQKSPRMSVTSKVKMNLSLSKKIFNKTAVNMSPSQLALISRLENRFSQVESPKKPALNSTLLQSSTKGIFPSFAPRRQTFDPQSNALVLSTTESNNGESRLVRPRFVMPTSEMTCSAMMNDTFQTAQFQNDFPPIKEMDNEVIFGQKIPDIKVLHGVESIRSLRSSITKTPELVKSASARNKFLQNYHQRNSQLQTHSSGFKLKHTEEEGGQTPSPVKGLHFRSNSIQKVSGDLNIQDSMANLIKHSPSFNKKDFEIAPFAPSKTKLSKHFSSQNRLHLSDSKLREKAILPKTHMLDKQRMSPKKSDKSKLDLFSNAGLTQSPFRHTLNPYGQESQPYLKFLPKSGSKHSVYLNKMKSPSYYRK